MESKNKISWLLFLIVSIFLGWYILFVAKVQQAGDIVEYFGVTESLTNHRSIELTKEDRNNLEEVLHPAYFEMPGYYIKGKDNNRYPVHFWFYSLLATPIRNLLSSTPFDLKKSLIIINWLSIVTAVGFISSRYIKNNYKKVGLILTVFSGALMSFLMWPGPDLWYLSLLLIVPFAFFKREYWFASILTAIASWHSQPLAIMTAGLTVFGLYKTIKKPYKIKKIIKSDSKNLAKASFIGFLLFIPYIYNAHVFNALTPWTELRDGWTVINGFGIQNISFKKFFEQWFDPNIGLFWYAPAVFLLSISGIVLKIKKTRYKNQKIETLFFIFISLLTAFFYQTNPAWHYGTVGFGPGRHSVFLLPILIYFALKNISSNTKSAILINIILITQIWNLSLNGYLEPDFSKTLHHSYYSNFILKNWPEHYNPTPEIFIDRTNHTDFDYPTTAIYKIDNKCIKAYALITDKEFLQNECGYVPKEYNDHFDDPNKRISNYNKSIVAKEITFWPYLDMCSKSFVKTKQQPFECMYSESDFKRLTGFTDSNRISTVENFEYPGIWKITKGDPVKVIIPPGYVVGYRSMNGAYVNY